MNIIERAGRQLGLKPSPSLVERAAERLSPSALVAETAAPAAERLSPSALVAETAAAPAPTTFVPSESEERRVPKPPVRHGTRRQIALDFDRLRSQGFSLPADQSPLAEEFRLIKRPLLQTALAETAASEKNANVIMVTSAQPHEGKTFVAVNLALSMASEHDLHVLLIDADFPNPSVPRILGFEAKTGLIDLVSGSSADFSEVLIRTNIENLTVLAAGQTKPGSSELLASGRMARFVDEVSRRYPDRITIFDAPPVLARSEPIVLAKHVGQVVMVMEAERTSRTALEEAIGLVGAERVAGVVLNKAPTVAHDQFGGYYGNYGRY